MTRLGGHGLDHVFLRVRSRGFSEVTRSWTDSTGPDGGVHLGSIGTLPAFRGRGYAGALTARMTADGVTERGLVTLGLYDDNVPARRVYERLGFVVAHEVETWQAV